MLVTGTTTTAITTTGTTATTHMGARIVGATTSTRTATTVRTRSTGSGPTSPWADAAATSGSISGSRPRRLSVPRARSLQGPSVMPRHERDRRRAVRVPAHPARAAGAAGL